LCLFVSISPAVVIFHNWWDSSSTHVNFTKASQHKHFFKFSKFLSFFSSRLALPILSRGTLLNILIKQIQYYVYNYLFYIATSFWTLLQPSFLHAIFYFDPPSNQKNVGPNKFSRFDVYLPQTNKQPGKQGKGEGFRVT